MKKFNRENAVKIWLREFRKDKAFDDATVHEMELHINDHVDDLVSEGHDELEAFEIAVKEFGDIPTMAEEEYSNYKVKNSIIGFLFQLSNLRIALRRFTKHPFITSLNTLGLAVGIAGAMLMGIYIHDEMVFDTMFADADRIYRINIDNMTNGEYSEYASAPGPMGSVIAEDCSSVQLVTRFREMDGILIRPQDSTYNLKEEYVTAVDSAFFEMFGLNLIDGDPATALKNPNSVVLTESASKRLFGKRNALGLDVLVDNEQSYIVTGILPDLPPNSFLRNHSIFMSLSSFEDSKTIAWNTWYFPTFVKLYPDSRVKDLQAFLDTVKDSYLIPWAMAHIPGLTVEKAKKMEEETGDFMRFNNIALTDIHLYSHNREGEFSINSDIQNVYILAIVALFLIMMASVNFMNLSTANSLQRAKEVGIRKTLGSNRRTLILNFITESIVQVMVSMILAIALASIAIPAFNLLSGKSIAIPWGSLDFWFVLILASVLLGLLSGFYPAIFMSRFAPAHMLKKNNSKVGGKSVRNSLVVFQLVISIFLIIGTIVVFQQVSYIQSKDLGFQKDQIFVIEDVDAAGDQMESFKNDVNQLSQVENVSLSSFLPTPSNRRGITFFSEGAFIGDELMSEKALIIENWGIDDEYLTTLGLELVAGRNFVSSSGSDRMSLIVNETTAEMLGLSPDEAIGFRLTNDFRRPDKENMEYMTIIGVVKNFHFESMRNRIDAVSMALADDADKMIVRLNSDNYEETINELERRWIKVAPDQPFHYYFLDDSFNNTFKSELQLGRILVVFTQLSIFIACLGLFGLATFAAQKRAKEIGIKKVLGASVKLITYQLSFDFLKLVGFAILISIPLSWFIMNQWLEEFAFRIGIKPWVLIVSALLAISISLLTVIYQSIKAAISNPVKSLRAE